VDSLQKHRVPTDTDATSSFRSHATDNHPRPSSSSVAAVSPSLTEGFPTLRADGKHRPSVIKHGEKDVEGEFKSLDSTTFKQIKVFDDEESKPKIPVKPGRGIENKKAMRPSSSRRTASKDSVKGK
jgi:hypothetical protein